MVDVAPLPRYAKRTLGGILSIRTEHGVGASVKEDWMFDTVVSAGLPVPVRNLRVEVGGVIREIHLAYPDLLIAIEYDAVSVHGDPAHFFADREKAALLQLAGWIVLQVTSQWTAQTLLRRVSQAIAKRQAA